MNVTDGDASSDYGGGVEDSGTLNLSNGAISDCLCGLGGAGVAILSGGTLTMNTVTLANNSVSAGGSGGGLYNAGTAMLNNPSITDDTVTALGSSSGPNGDGGGIFNQGVMNIQGGTFTDNVAGYGGDGIGQGGALFNQGTTTIQGGAYSSNTAGYGGGGIFNAGSMTAEDISLTGNTTVGAWGGGMNTNPDSRNSQAVSTLIDVTIADNSAQTESGGGLAGINDETSDTSTVNLTNVTITGNTAAKNGGGIFIDPGNVNSSFVNVTVTGNSAVDAGGGLFDNAVNPAFGNTIIAGNSVSSGGVDPDASGAVTSQGHNLIGITDGSSGWVSSDLTGTSARPLAADLGALANNGGPTETILPQTGSPAIGAGSIALIPSGITTDQRGLPRIVNGAVDIGAVEVQARGSTGSTAASTTLSASAATVTSAQAVTLTAAVTASSGTPTGAVTFFDNGSALGTAALNASGLATFTTAPLPVGSDSLSARYGGDANDAASQSNTLSQTVLAASSAPAILGRVVAPTEVLAGQRFICRVPVLLANSGSILTGRFTATLYLDTASMGLDGQAIELGSLVKSARLASGRSLTLSLRGQSAASAVPAGTYFLVAKVTDPDGGTDLITSGQTIVVAPATVALQIDSAVFAPNGFSVRPQAFAFTVTVSNTGNVPAVGVITISDEGYNSQFPLGSASPVVDTFRANIRPGKSQRFIAHRRYRGQGTFPAGTFASSVQAMLDGASASLQVPASYTVS